MNHFWQALGKMVLDGEFYTDVAKRAAYQPSNGGGARPNVQDMRGMQKFLAQESLFPDRERVYEMHRIFGGPQPWHDALVKALAAVHAKNYGGSHTVQNILGLACIDEFYLQMLIARKDDAAALTSFLNSHSVGVPDGAGGTIEVIIPDFQASAADVQSLRALLPDADVVAAAGAVATGWHIPPSNPRAACGSGATIKNTYVRPVLSIEEVNLAQAILRERENADPAVAAQSALAGFEEDIAGFTDNVKSIIGSQEV